MVTVEVVTKLHQLLQLIEVSIEESAGPRWFRGSGSFEKHKLIPSLFRHPDVLKGDLDAFSLEQRLQTRFIQTSPPFLGNKPTSKLEWLFTAQHYGVPSRLLDWSENPFIALYFALSSSPADEIACLWILDPVLWTRRSLNNPALSRVPDPVDSALKRFMESLDDDLAPPVDPIAIHSNHINPRIVAQRGTFTIFGKGTSPMEQISYARECMRCVLIEPGIKPDLYKKLLSIGYTHSVIYPDLSGLGVELKSYFGF